MNYKNILSIFLLACFTFVFANSADAQHKKYRRRSDRDFRRGNYISAVDNAVRSLQIRPDYVKAQASIQRAYPVAVGKLENEIAKLKVESDKFVGPRTVQQRKQIVTHYETLIRITNDVRALPPLINGKTGAKVGLDYKDYSAALAKAKRRADNAVEDAAEEYYQKALEQKEMGGVENYKEAALLMRKSLEYISDYKDAKELYQEYKKLGTKKIAIIPFENKSNSRRYGAIGEMLSDQVIGYVIKNDQAMEFTEIVTLDQMNILLQQKKKRKVHVGDELSLVQAAKDAGIHEIIYGKISQVIISDPNDIKKTVKEEKKVKTLEKYKDKDGKEKKREKIEHAKVTVNIYTRKASAKMTGSYKIIEVKTGKLRDNQTFSKNYHFEHKWATYRGDKRALSDGNKKLSDAGEKNPISAGERVNQLISTSSSEISHQIINYLIN